MTTLSTDDRTDQHGARHRGLMPAGVAVTSLLARQLPRGVAGTMLAVAVVAELSILSLVVEPLGVLVVVGRFGGMAALVAAGALLPTRRAAPHAA